MRAKKKEKGLILIKLRKKNGKKSIRGNEDMQEITFILDFCFFTKKNFQLEYS